MRTDRQMESGTKTDMEMETKPNRNMVLETKTDRNIGTGRAKDKHRDRQIDGAKDKRVR